MQVTIVIGGDVCPIGRNESLFKAGDANSLLSDLLPEVEQADLSLVNLECPLIRAPSPSEKCGPHLGAPDTCVQGLVTMNVGVVGLANNHIMDHGPSGLKSTIEALQRTGIGYTGAGKNLDEARKMMVSTVRGIRIGILAMAEREFGIASPGAAGANPLSPIDFVRQMRSQQDRVDYLVVLLHGGKEYYPYPSPELQDVCRFLIEEGANVVICQHSHCPGCYEHYRNGFIVYGQGNFLFDRYPKKRRNWNRGFLVKLSIGTGGTTGIELLPYIQSDEQPGARRMSEDAAAPFLQELKTRSDRISDQTFLVENWQKFCRSRRPFYFSALRGHSFPIEVINHLTGYTRWLYSKRALRRLLNVIRCEAHREVLLSILAEQSR